MHKVVLLRHGESDWNRENRFTGWTDVDLSERGRGCGVATPALKGESGPSRVVLAQRLSWLGGDAAAS